MAKTKKEQPEEPLEEKLWKTADKMSEELLHKTNLLA